MKAIIGIFALAMAFNAQAGFFNFPENTTETQACTCETQAVSKLDIINSDLKMSQQMLSLSQSVLAQSEKLMKAGDSDSVNIEYVNGYWHYG